MGLIGDTGTGTGYARDTTLGGRLTSLGKRWCDGKGEGGR